ncbi:hypothetical protein BC629DRAFT_580150 [Irpex lacteus]|nr:hypothetical protein BC629DRAFT_580150 [Irpex lacteus]
MKAEASAGTYLLRFGFKNFYDRSTSRSPAKLSYEYAYTTTTTTTYIDPSSSCLIYGRDRLCTSRRGTSDKPACSNLELEDRDDRSFNSRGMGVPISHRTVPRTHGGSQLIRHSPGKGASSIFTLCSFAAKLRSRYSEQYWQGCVHVFSLVKANLKVGIRILHCLRSLAPTLSLPRHRMPTAE